MRPVLGWTMLSREERRQVERALAKSEQETRDEIGFLLIHQGLADRFFPGTSVLHTRVRYALFVPWIYRTAAYAKRGGDLERKIEALLKELAFRLKALGREPYGVIGGEKLGFLTDQPPDRTYWPALRTWGLLDPTVHARWEAIRRLRTSAMTRRDDDGAPLEENPGSVFMGLPKEPEGWNDPNGPLRFRLEHAEQEFLKSKLENLRRPDGEPCLLATLAAAGDSFDREDAGLPPSLDASADRVDRQALAVARDAAELAAIGRAVYGALVEQLRRRDGVQDTGFRQQLRAHFDLYGTAAVACDLNALEALLPALPLYMRTVLRHTQAFIREGRPDRFEQLRDCYADAETRRKTPRRARLGDTAVAAQRRAEWDPDPVKQTRPLHYRWGVVRDILADLGAR